MSRNVFILGAGASKQSGAPLMDDFLDKAEDIYRANPDLKDFKVVFSALSDLQSVYSKSYLDLDNIETLFGVIEMAVLIGRLNNYSVDEIKLVRDSLINMIVKTLEDNIKFPIKETNMLPPEPYDLFASLIKVVKDSSIITFNYDMSIDYALHTKGFEIDYCLNLTEQADKYKLMKLHGSVGWGRCPRCNMILPMYLHEHSNIFKVAQLPKRRRNEIAFSFSSKLSRLKHDICHNMTSSSVPVIVPPTWNKTEYHGDLTNVWSNAARELVDSNNIFVIGYSLPETDSFFRYLFALGTVSQTRINRFWVFNPDNRGPVNRRFESMIGRGIAKKYQYIDKDFVSAIDIIYDELKRNNLFEQEDGV